MRDDKWLFQKLDEVWDNYFPDIHQDNDVKIVWGRRARTRLGSIRQIPNNNLQIANKLQNSKLINSNFIRKSKIENHKSKEHPATLITINSLFKDENIPEYVVLGTIAHELSHYAHGFNSPLERKYQTPHAGGVVHKEMKDRGLGEVLKKQKKWLKENWRDYVMEKLPPKKRRIVVRWF